MLVKPTAEDIQSQKLCLRLPAVSSAEVKKDCMGNSASGSGIPRGREDTLKSVLDPVRISVGNRLVIHLCRNTGSNPVCCQ